MWIEKLFSPGWSARPAPGDLTHALGEVLADLERDFGAWKVVWGEIDRHQRFDSNAELTLAAAVAAAKGDLSAPPVLANDQLTRIREKFASLLHQYRTLGPDERIDLDSP